MTFKVLHFWILHVQLNNWGLSKWLHLNINVLISLLFNKTIMMLLMSIKLFTFYACLSSPAQTNHLIVVQHSQEGLHPEEERLCRCILPCPLLCRSDGSSLSNAPTISLIKAACGAGEGRWGGGAGGTSPSLSPLRTKLLTPLKFPQDSVHCFHQFAVLPEHC